MKTQAITWRDATAPPDAEAGPLLLCLDEGGDDATFRVGWWSPQLGFHDCEERSVQTDAWALLSKPL